MVFHFSYFFTALVMFFIMVINIKKSKSFLDARVIFPVLWILALLFLSFDNSLDSVSNIVLIISILTYLLFSLGYSIAGRRQMEYGQNILAPKCLSEYNWLGIQVVFFISVTIGVLYIYHISSFTSFSKLFSDPLSLQKSITNGAYSLPRILVWLGVFIRCSFWYYSYLIIGSFRNKSHKLYKNRIVLRFEYLIIILLTVVWQMTRFSRNGVLYTILPLLMMMFLLRKWSNKKIGVVLAFSFIAFMLFFFWFNNLKFSWDYDSMPASSVALNTKYLSLYLCGSFVGLSRLIENSQIGFISFNGVNHTFTLFLSIIDSLFGTSFSPDVVQEFVEIGSVGRTNVYTVLHWTASDFGLLYSFLWVVIYGLIYGIIFKKANEGNNKAIYFYSLLFYALCMMFFQDQLIAISESWFFVIIFSLIIFALCEKQPQFNYQHVFKSSKQFGSNYKFYNKHNQ